MNNQPKSSSIEKPFILRYRVLRTSLLFTLLWGAAAIGTPALIWLYRYPINSAKGLTLILSGLLCLILAVHSWEQHGSPYIYLYSDHLKIHYSLLRNLTICFHDIRRLYAVKEELEIILETGRPIYLNLAHLSFEDQKLFLEKLHEIIRENLETAKPSHSSTFAHIPK